MLPATIVRRPLARSMPSTSTVTVVFPSVPVTATIGRVDQRAASSNSLHTGVPAARAAWMAGCPSGTPGLGTTTPVAATSGSTAASSSTVTPRRASVAAASRLAGEGRSSTAVTSHPRWARRRAAASPATPSPTTSARLGLPATGSLTAPL